MKTDEIAEALRTFIKSGSANGREDMRRYCLKTVPVFAAAPELLEAVQFVISAYANGGGDEAGEYIEGMLPQFKAIVAKAT